MSDLNTSQYTRTDFINMFLDATIGEVYNLGRLKTVANDDGSIDLIAYHREVIANYEPVSREVTVYSGHFNDVSRTVNTYLSEVIRLAGTRKGRTVSLSERSPATRQRPVIDSAQYIDRHVSREGTHSPAEKKAVQEINASLKAEL